MKVEKKETLVYDFPTCSFLLRMRDDILSLKKCLEQEGDSESPREHHDP